MSCPAPNLKHLPLHKVEADPRAQARAGINQAKVEEYTEALAQGDEFPPIIVFHEPSDPAHWLADGWHRFRSHQLAKRKTILVEVRPGGIREAILFAVGANPTHGLPRTRADKRRAVEILLQDAEWRKWSDSAIARHAHVSRPFVAMVRADLSCNVAGSRLVSRGDQKYEQRPPKVTKPAERFAGMSPQDQLEERRRQERPTMQVCPTCEGRGEVPA